MNNVHAHYVHYSEYKEINHRNSELLFSYWPPSLPQAMSCLLNCAHRKYTVGDLEDFAVGQQIEAAKGFDDIVLRIRPEGEKKDKVGSLLGHAET